MFNNIALDVVIGLVLVFLLYSLLVTILSEMVASWLGFRQRMLRLCIERMLNDGYYDHDSGSWKRRWHKIEQTFLVEFDQFPLSVAGRFYNEPSIKYLAKGDRTHWPSFTNSKPSYIDPGTFALTLIHLMRDKGRGDTDIAKIQYCLTYNTLHFQRETLKGISSMLTDSGCDIQTFGNKLKSWFIESVQRNTGWYKRMMRIVSFFLGLCIALVFNIDSIRIAQLLSRDKEARGELVRLAVGVSHDTLLANNYGNPAAPSDRSTAIVDSSLSHVSRDISSANYVLGLGWGFDRLGNKVVDTFNGKKDRVGYAALLDVQTAAEKVEVYRDSIRVFEPKHRAAVRYIRLQQALNIPPEKIAGKDSLFHMTDSLNKYLILFSVDSLRSYGSVSSRVDTLTGMNFFTVGPIRSIARPVDSLLVIQGLTPYSSWHKFRYWFSSAFCSGWLRILGLLLTAIALSLGAPFWFDMLAKIVAIRGSGTNPTPPKQPKEIVITDGPVLINIPVGATPAPGPPPGPLTIAVQSCRSDLAGIPGVLSIDEGLKGRKGSMTDVIEIHVLDAKCAARVRTQLGSPYKTFPLNILVTAQAKVHLQSGDTIMNAVVNQQPVPTVNNGTGTLGCFVKKDNGNAQYLISCWHVLKGDWDWTSHGGPNLVTDGNGNNIGTVVDGCLSTDMDIGFALLNKTGFKNSFTKKCRAVTKEDVNQQMTVKFHGAHSGSVSDPIIFNPSVSITGGLEYPDGVHRVLTDMFSITRVVDGTAKPPSDHGDSGSLVLDANNVPLGILVGADNMFTYVAKLSNILAADGIYKEYQLSI